MTDQLPLRGYDFETKRASDIVCRRSVKPPEVGGSVVLDVPGRGLAWLKVAFLASIERCELEWKRLIREGNYE